MGVNCTTLLVFLDSLRELQGRSDPCHVNYNFYHWLKILFSLSFLCKSWNFSKFVVIDIWFKY